MSHRHPHGIIYTYSATPYKALISSFLCFRCQTEDLGLCLKVVEHAPQRWLSLVKVLERVIRLWHPLKKLYKTNSEVFPLEEGDNEAGILQLYSLMEPVAAIIRDGQHGSLPMNGKMHMALSLLKATTLRETEPLKVTQIYTHTHCSPRQTRVRLSLDN